MDRRQHRDSLSQNSADFLRAIPFDDEDVANENACMGYTTSFEPI